MDADVVIVGGGPAGAATALFCAHHRPGWARRILLIDKARFPRDKICAGAIGRRADRALETIGVEVDVPSVAIRGLSVATGVGSLAVRERETIGRVVRRRAFDAALLDRAREAGIVVRDGVELTDLRRRATGVRLTTSAGELTAEAVVGADGVGSRVRRALGLGRGPYHAQAIEVDTPLRPGDPPLDDLHFNLIDDSYPGYAWDFPTLVDGRVMMCRGVYQLTRGAGPVGADVGALLNARLVRQGLDPEGFRTRRFSERGLSLHQPTSFDRALLVGEAAGIDPVLGEGIAQAVLYGAVAGRFLARAAERGDWSMRGFAAALGRSRVGIDLRLRALMTRVIYGGTRPLIERWISRSTALARGGMAYFSGRRVPRHLLARAALDLVISSAWAGPRRPRAGLASRAQDG